MSEYKNYDNIYDTDTADCGHCYDTEVSTDRTAEFDTEAANDFVETPVEFSTRKNAEATSEFNETPTEFDTETGADSDVPHYEVTESNLRNDSDVQNSASPQDETAATSDELYTTQCARAKCALDDYEIISDVLGAEKQLVKLYSTALCEASEENFRDIIRENLIECAADQYSTFEYMEKRGMYPTEEADEEKITEAKQQFTPLCKCCD